MATISSIGVGSGLPLDDLLTKLRSQENTALVAIQKQQVQAESRLSAYGTLKNALSALNTAGEQLARANTLGALKASVAGDAYTATADSSAIAGSYHITVQALASAQTLVSQGVASRTEALAEGGVITVTLNDGSQAQLDLAGQDTSLEGLVRAINSHTELGLAATLVNDGSDTPHRLLLTARETGTEHAVQSITVSADTHPDQLLQTLIGFDAGQPGAGIQERAATNARISINGIEITSSSNEVRDAIEGVTLKLSKVSDDPVALTISRDDSAAVKAVNAFVSAYNALQSGIRTLTSYDLDSQSASPLTGDNLARRIQTQMQGVLNIALPEGGLRTLSQLGLSTEPPQGTLKLDEEKLTAALKNNLSDVQALLAGKDGLSSRVAAASAVFLASDGLIESATNGIDRSIVNLQTQYDTTLQRIDARMETYRKQFVALDSMVTSMNGISTYLTQQLSMLGNMAKNDK